MPLRTCQPYCLLLAAIVSCAPERDETTTKGHLNVVVGESVTPILAIEVRSFMDLYRANGADLTYSVSPSEAVNFRFVRNTDRMIITATPLTPDEKQIVRKTTDELVELILAYDGVVAVVQEKNSCSQLSLRQIQDILGGKITRWDELGRFKNPRGGIHVVVGDSSDAGSYLSRRLLAGKGIRIPHRSRSSPLQILDEVARDPQALGFGDLAWLDSAKTRIKVLAIATDSMLADTAFMPDHESFGSFFSPNPAYIYLNSYPLKRAIYGYARTTRGDLPTGFISFIASAAGQQIVLKKGLVPATQKIRLRPPE